MKESAIVRQACILLRRNGWWYYKVHGGGWSRAGIPDLICLKEGFTLWIEFKQPGEKPSKLQEIVMKELLDHEGDVMVATDAMQCLRDAEARLREWHIENFHPLY